MEFNKVMDTRSIQKCCVSKRNFRTDRTANTYRNKYINVCKYM